MKSLEQQIQQPFQTPEEEVAFLRKVVAEREKELLEQKVEASKEKITANVVEEYQALNDTAVINQSRMAAKAEAEAIVLNLAPERHDEAMAELLSILLDHGLKAALSAAAKLNNPHVEDDFHRFLTAYIHQGYTPIDAKAEPEVFKALHMTLYEVALRLPTEQENKDLKTLLSSMEQLYEGLFSVQDEHENEPSHFTLEIANANGSHEFVVYAAIPDSKAQLFEKQATALFPGLKLTKAINDYNIFNEQGVTLGATAQLSHNAIFPLKTYEQFDSDPLSVIINSLTKLQRDGEGAAIQFVIRPPQYKYNEKYLSALEKIQGGEKVDVAINIPFTGGQKVIRFLDNMMKTKKKEDETKQDTKKPVDQAVMEKIRAKIATKVVEVGIRVLTSAENSARAHAILDEITASFNQFALATSNEIKWDHGIEKKMRALIERFSYRLAEERMMPLSVKELTSVFHIPQSKMSNAQLKQNLSTTAPAPFDMPREGVLLGINTHEGNEREVFIQPEDRLRHMYVIGQTGTGKTSLLKQLIIQDIKRGEGVCLIDPHGSDVMDILAQIPKERYDDVIYFDPSYTPRPMGLNMLEYDVNFPEQKTYVVNEMLSIFNKLFDMKTAGGPMFEQYFRNAVMLVLEDPESGSTLLDVSRVLVSKSFRDAKLAKCNNPLVKQFWKEMAEKAGGEGALQNIVPYITSKFDNFLSNDIMRPIVTQQKSAFQFREIMDKKKILLVNLAKGRLGDLNSHLIGLILVGKILMAALSRVDSFGKDMPPFYLYIDEFQNVTTDSISTILSEARKYKLSLTIAHQFIGQLQDNIKNAVFGNVGSMAVFRVGAEDSEVLSKQFEPHFKPNDIMNLDNFNAYAKVLMSGKPVPPFNIRTLKPEVGNRDQVEPLKELSYLTYGKDRALVEREIMERYN